MEYVRGGTVLDYVNAYGPCAEFRGRHVVSQLADAVAHLHSEKTCHRDVKCDNIIVGSVTHEGCCIQLSDFGLPR
eukprot:4885283-Pyramimonas_sp.AAC.1